MPYRDLRDWIERLEKEGELLRIREEISPEPDVGALGRATCDIEGPGILAEKITGFEGRLATCLMASWRTTALALDLPKDTSRRDMVKAWMDAFDRPAVKAKVVSDAPCKENILTGEKIDLFQFPIPRINFNDASFYISKGMSITRDPDSDWTNVGIYRMMVLDRNRTAIHVTTPAQHFRFHIRKHYEAGKPMDVAVAIGTEPVLPMVAAMKIPGGWSEYDFAGTLREEPEELVKAETIDLLVPARAEIVLEGVVHTDRQVFEGPFGEHTGAYSSCYWASAFEIKAITHRNNPIFESLYLGRPYSECNYLSMLGKIAGLQYELQGKFPQITEIAYQLPDLYNVVVQGRWGHTGEPKRVMSAFWGSSFGVPTKMVTVVDEDIDPWDAQDVLWAIATRCQASKDIVIIPGCEGALDPSTEPDATSCKLGIDATKTRPPFHRHKTINWITPPRGTQEWKDKILQLCQRGGN
ncbi:UbiD family decarboxylase [Chloroflexota bacterium]